MLFIKYFIHFFLFPVYHILIMIVIVIYSIINNSLQNNLQGLCLYYYIIDSAIPIHIYLLIFIPVVKYHGIKLH